MFPLKTVECDLAGETELVGQNLALCHFLHHKTDMTQLEPEPPRWEARDYAPELWHGLVKL
jgi:hypothetical protein